MMVDQIEPAYLVLREPLDATQTVVVDASADVKRWQSVEVTGTTAVDQGGGLHLADARVRAYVDDAGEIVLPPLPKPLIGPLDIFKTVDVTLSPSESAAVGAREQVREALLSEPTLGTIAWVKTLQDGAELTYPLEGKIVSRVFKNEGCYYIQEPDRSAGIRVDDLSATILEPGDVITIYEYGATIGTVDGERVLSGLSGQLGEPVEPPLPLGTGSRALGAGAFSDYTPGPAGGVGLNNVGLLVRVWGKVSATTLDYFYVDDGSNVVDGSGEVGVRILGLQGYQPYKPAVGDYVSLTGISGLATVEGSYARAVRVADYTELVPIRPNGPPVALEVHATGISQITCYWRGVPGATGYNIYRGTTSGGEDYQNPVNSATPWNTPSYPGSDVFAFTNTGLSTGAEYFYTVKAVRSYGESGPSFEDSDTPDPYAIPWDSDDAYAVTSAVESMCGCAPDLTRVVGPDGTIYCSQLGVLRPGGSVDLGTLLPGTNLLHYGNGSNIAVPDDGSELGGEEEESGMQATAIPETEVRPYTDGPIRRVRSESTYTGSYGVFAPGWRNQIYMSIFHPNGTYWTYLGSRWDVLTNQGRSRGDIDAGLQWSRAYNLYNPYLSLKLKRPDGDVLARFLAPLQPIIRFDTSVLFTISMAYALQPYPLARGSIPMLQISGFDESWTDKTVLLAAANPIKSKTGMMKRAHSIAQGGIKRCINTGSYFEYAAFEDGALRDGNGNWLAWTGERSADQGRYPASPPAPQSTVEWSIPVGREYWEENNISIHANYTDTR